MRTTEISRLGPKWLPHGLAVVFSLLGASACGRAGLADPTVPPTSAYKQLRPTAIFTPRTELPTPVPTHTYSLLSTPTHIRAIAFPPGSLARALAGSPDCHLPCWAGLTPGKSRSEDTDAWLAAMRLSQVAQRSEGDGDLYVRGANPGALFFGPLAILQFHLSSRRLTSISMDRVPLGRPIVEELADITSLLGFPDRVIATEIQGVYPSTFDLELVYLSSGVELIYIGDLASVSIAGESRDAICLSAATRRDVTIFLASDLSWMIDDPFDWARRMGMQEGELFSRLLQEDQCVPMNP